MIEVRRVTPLPAQHQKAKESCNATITQLQRFVELLSTNFIEPIHLTNSQLSY